MCRSLVGPGPKGLESLDFPHFELKNSFRRWVGNGRSRCCCCFCYLPFFFMNFSTSSAATTTPPASSECSNTVRLASNETSLLQKKVSPPPPQPLFPSKSAIDCCYHWHCDTEGIELSPSSSPLEFARKGPFSVSLIRSNSNCGSDGKRRTILRTMYD